jgi:prepilin peptidase CpaA
MCVGIALLLLPYLMGGMGAGDTKLMGAVGAVLGIERTVTAFLLISAMGCLYALLIIVFQRRRMKGYFKQMWLTAQGILLTRKYMPVESGEEKRPKVYYGVAIAAGTLMYLALEITGAIPAP